MDWCQELPSSARVSKEASTESPLGSNDDYVVLICKKDDPMVKNHLKLNGLPIYSKEGTITPHQYKQSPCAQNPGLTNISNHEDNILNMKSPQEENVRSGVDNGVTLNVTHGDNPEGQVAVRKDRRKNNNPLSRNQRKKTGRRMYMHTEEKALSGKQDLQALETQTNNFEKVDLHVRDELVMDLVQNDDADASSADGPVGAELPHVDSQCNALICKNGNRPIPRNQLKRGHTGRGIVYQEECNKEANSSESVTARKNTSEKINRPLDLTPRKTDTSRKEVLPVDLSPRKSHSSRKVTAKDSATLEAPRPVDLIPNKPIEVANDVAEGNSAGRFEAFRQMTEQKKPRRKIEKERTPELAVSSVQPNTNTANVQNEMKRPLSVSENFQSPDVHSQNGNKMLESQVATSNVSDDLVGSTAQKRSKRQYTTKGDRSITHQEKLRNKAFVNYVVSKMNTYPTHSRMEVEHAFYTILLNADKGYFDRIPPGQPPLHSLNPNIVRQPAPQNQSTSGHPPMQFMVRDQQCHPMVQARPQMFTNTSPFDTQFPQQDSANIASFYLPQQTIRHQYDPQLAIQCSQYIQNHQYDPSIPASTPTQQIPINQYDPSISASLPTHQLPAFPFNQQSPAISNQKSPAIPNQQSPAMPNQQSPILSNQQSPTLSNQQSPTQQQQPPNPPISAQFQTSTSSSSQYSGISPTTITLESSDNEDYA